MRMLVLGGTSFVGRHIVEAALAQGHELTLFNRGRTNPDLFPGVEHRHGDRDASDLAALGSGEWDALVDVNGYRPRHVREVADLVAGRVGTYCFISTGAVYADFGAAIDEDAALATLEPGADETSFAAYGPLKVLCEREAQAAFPGHCVVVRAGLVAGPHDPTDRFTYWVRRLTRGGRLLGPPRPEQPVQLVHARDQGDFVLRLLSTQTAGVFNSVGPDEPITFADMVEACTAAAGTTADVTWAPEPFLVEHEVVLPLARAASGATDGIYRVSTQRSRARGLVNRPIADTAADVLAWDRTRDQTAPLLAGPSPAREAELLALL